MRNYLMAIPVVFLLTGCYQKTLLFSAETTSMTHSNSGTASLDVKDEVKEKWCAGDKPVTGADESVYGLADQAIYKAQHKGGKSDFIVEAKVYIDTNNCAIVEGKKAVIKK